MDELNSDRNDNSISWIENKINCREERMREVHEIIPPGISEEARSFHRQVPGYRQTPLKGLNELADMLGIGGIWVKDESQRLNLNSFKALGGSFAIYRFLRRELGREGERVSLDEIRASSVDEDLAETIFATATDGNHGRGVAWAAEKLGYDSVIYVHEKTSKARIKAIESYGADTRIVGGTYDDAVKQLSKDADKNGWQIISDTSWPGYEEIPIWVMQGYTTMYREVQEHLTALGLDKPTHIFIQAGVGSLAASALAFYQGLLKDKRPKTIIVEPSKAACIYKSARCGKLSTVEGELDTIMAGLACGEPNPIAWNILNKCTDVFISCPDFVAAKGMRVYAVPLKNDPFVVSGESGAVTLGILTFIMEHPEFSHLKELLQLGPESQILLINTEGNTDPLSFRKVVWEGTNPVPSEFRVSNGK